MSDIRELYQQVILDHGRKPRCVGVMSNPSLMKQGFNPLCGDRLTLYIQASEGKITDVSFDGDGCAISMASASLMSEAIKGMTIEEAEELFELFHQMITEPNTSIDEDALGKLVVLKGVTEYPARVKCATLAWQTLRAAIQDDHQPVSTET
tara:strand:+ start:8034 stop:8486 length:453 start_codon:yes stop_codon:yes gene_type:complete